MKHGLQQADSRKVKKLLSSAMLGLLVALTVGCDSGSSGSDLPPVKSLEFAPFKIECFSWFYAFCPGARSVGATQWGGNFYGIEGYQWKWGHFAVVEYREYPIDEPLQDGPAIRRVLERVVSEDPAPDGYEFTLGLRASDPYGRPEDIYITKLQDGLYEYRDTAIECNTIETCGELDLVIEQDSAFVGTFTFGAQLTPPLVLQEVVCIAPNEDQRVRCEMMASR